MDQRRRTFAILICAIHLTAAAHARAERVAEPPASRPAGDPDKALAEYRHKLEAFRAEFGGGRPLPDVPFFLFGMGGRAKFLYKDGELREAPGGKVVRRWEIAHELILPPEYEVRLTTRDGRVITLVEDELGVWVREGGKAEAVAGTEHRVRLPKFDGYRYPGVMRVLHQELLVNVVDGKPVPNYFVYPRPWYRDGAMMAMCFKATGNVGEIKDWVLHLSEPYDRNNAGEAEADNPGQALYLISLVSDKDHPLVKKLLAELGRLEVKGEAGTHVRGRSDFAEHPAYQTKWAKFGLKALGLPDPYTVPRGADSYSALFWMDFRDDYTPGKDADDAKDYPYLRWACDHFHGARHGPIGNRDYPLTWEANASQAKYEGMSIISTEYTRGRLAAPHTWHAAETFLYLLDRTKR